MKMMRLRYYDILYDSCKPDRPFQERLGFESVFFVRKGSRFPVCASSDASVLLKALQGNAVAIAITDFTIDRKLMVKVKESGALLCIPFSEIVSRTGFQRTRLIYKATAMLKYAYNKRIDVSFASLAESELYMNSRMQLVELARMLGATEEQARQGVSSSNKRIGDAIDQG